MENSLDNMHIRDLKIEDEVSIEYVITEENLARVRRRLRGKFGVKTPPVRLEFGRRQTIIANSRELRDLFTLSYSSEVINDEEFILLYGVFSSKNLNLPYEGYQRFSFDHMKPDECKAEFRF